MTSPKPLDWLSEAEHAIAAAVEKHGQCALLYSGGIESSLLLHLAAPRRDRISVYTVRTGAEFPHMMDFIDRTLRDWEHRVITVNLGASFGELGLPASAVPYRARPRYRQHDQHQRASPAYCALAVLLRSQSVATWLRGDQG
jgi:3'-phosphoadenosine 5'-phosphosulfate sulfotransferase (PAPS reductase)/FAD synthetase